MAGKLILVLFFRILLLRPSKTFFINSGTVYAFNSIVYVVFQVTIKYKKSSAPLCERGAARRAEEFEKTALV